MKVADVMSKHVDYLPENAKVKKLCLLILAAVSMVCQSAGEKKL